MKAMVIITKSFEDGKREFTKQWGKGDFHEFFKDEGTYLDTLADATEIHGNSGDGFTVTYTVTLTK